MGKKKPFQNEVLKTALSEPISDAPALLFKSMVKLRSIIGNYKVRKDANPDTIKTYSDMYHAMVISWSYLQDIKYITDRNLILQQDLRLIQGRNAELTERLALYEGITKVKIDGNFDKIVANVDKFLESLNLPDEL
jgi:hypothetical protein